MLGGFIIGRVAHSKIALRDATVRGIALRRRSRAACHSSSGRHYMLLCSRGQCDMLSCGKSAHLAVDFAFERLDPSIQFISPTARPGRRSSRPRPKRYLSFSFIFLLGAGAAGVVAAARFVFLIVAGVAGVFSLLALRLHHCSPLQNRLARCHRARNSAAPPLARRKSFECRLSLHVGMFERSMPYIVMRLGSTVSG